MHFTHAGLVFTAVWLAARAPVAAQPTDPITAVTITAHVLQPQAVPPTDARLGSVEVPLGFALHRFADGLDNPRIMRTTADGTVYVTQRTPGNLVMLRDTNRDGVADVQKTQADAVKSQQTGEAAIMGAKTNLLQAVHEVMSPPDPKPSPMAQPPGRGAPPKQ